MPEHKQHPRTNQQNKALHKWFELVADELNASGQSKQKVLAKTVELNWDASSIKEDLWRPVQKAILKKHSTTELKKTEDIDKIWEHLNRFLGEKCGIHVPFPSESVSVEELTGGRIPLDNAPYITPFARTRHGTRKPPEEVIDTQLDKPYTPPWRR